MSKHAYLIMAHNNFYILEKLLMLLDDERNDIYIHIDKKIKNFNFDFYIKIAKFSNVYFTERINVFWGDFSQIKAEYILMSAAQNQKYDYYHLLSGVDLPIKTQDYIHDFFEKNKGKDYIQFVNSEYQEKTNSIYRISRYKFFQKYVRDANLIKKNMANLFQNIAMPLQTVLNINRLKNKNIKIGFGANWFSLTGETIKLVLSKKSFIEKYFKHSLCADELFVQTILLTFSDLKINYDLDFNSTSHLRLIDWKRGNPYVFRKDDYEALISSDCLFARKFDLKIDKEIIDLIVSDVG